MDFWTFSPTTRDTTTEPIPDLSFTIDLLYLFSGLIQFGSLRVIMCLLNIFCRTHYFLGICFISKRALKSQ